MSKYLEFADAMSTLTFGQRNDIQDLFLSLGNMDAKLYVQNLATYREVLKSLEK
jgi:hypothetical protein